MQDVCVMMLKVAAWTNRGGTLTAEQIVRSAVDDILDAYAPDCSRIPQATFTDAAVAEAELDRIFARTWLFVAHASEIAESGDYVTRRMGRDAVIVARGEDGQIRVMRNACTHRGTLLCKATLGNSTHFMCPYHAWTFDNAGRLRGVPEGRRIYGALNKADLGLRQARVETYQDLVFATWNPDAPSLREHLGDLAWYLDMLLGTASEGWEVGGPPQRYLASGNWKLPAENMGGDSYHVAFTHRSAIEAGLFGDDDSSVQGRITGENIWTAEGHTVRVGYMPEAVDGEPYWGYPAEVRADLEANATPEMLQVLRNADVVHGNIFPNLSFITTAMTYLGDDTQNTGFTSFRLSVPVGPNVTEMLTFALVPRSATPEWKDRSILTYERTHGAASVIFEGDDQDNFGAIQEASQGTIARSAAVDYSMGTLLESELDEKWPGPGNALTCDHSEQTHRAFHGAWLRMMKEDR